MPVEAIEDMVRHEKEKHVLPSEAELEEFFRDYDLHLEALIEEVAIIATRERGLIRMRAVELRMRAMKHRLEMAQLRGAVPATPEKVRVEIDAIRLADELVDFFEGQGLLTADLEAALGGIFARRGHPQMEPPGVEPVPAELNPYDPS